MCIREVQQHHVPALTMDGVLKVSFRRGSDPELTGHFGYDRGDAEA